MTGSKTENLYRFTTQLLISIVGFFVVKMHNQFDRMETDLNSLKSDNILILYRLNNLDMAKTSEVKPKLRRPTETRLIDDNGNPWIPPVVKNKGRHREEPEPEPDPVAQEKPKRKRRTKAELAAKKAELAAKVDNPDQETGQNQGGADPE
jgi:hypothetical protein